MPRRIHLLRTPAPPDAAEDAALSRGLLALVAEGAIEEAFRLYRTRDVLAFSSFDATRPGFAAAVRATRARGFDAAFRLAGGKAAVFTRESLAFAWALPVEGTRLGIADRFRALAGHVETALRRLGADARVGEVPGEYCPGEWSVNLGGRVKVMGVGQRVVRGAAHVGGVVVVREAKRVQDVLVPVYQALGYHFDPATAGALEDALPGIDCETVARELLAVIGQEAEWSEADAALARRAAEAGRAFAPRHRIHLENRSPHAGRSLPEEKIAREAD